MLNLTAHTDQPAPVIPAWGAAPLERLGTIELRRPQPAAGAGHRVLLDHLERRLDRLDAFADRVDQGFDGLERQVAIAFAERRARSRTV